MRVCKDISAARIGCIAAILLAGASTVLAFPPDPDNAAVIYYQAFLLYQQSEGAMSETLASFAKGTIDPNDQIREYVQNCRSAIDYASVAAQREHCNWGVLFSKGFNTALPHLAQCRALSRIMLADARLLAADGSYTEALDCCLSVKRLACHVGDDIVIAFLVAMAVDGTADETIGDILGMMPADPQAMEGFRTRWMLISASQPSLARGLRVEQEMAVDMMRMDRLDELIAVVTTENVPGAKEWAQKVNEDTLARNREHFVRHMTAMQDLLVKPIPYEKKHAELKTLVDRLSQDVGTNPDAALTAGLVPALSKIYDVETRARARANALRVAMDVHVARAKTGALPERLPPETAKDPYSGLDYLYEKTATGFVLRCQGKDLAKDTIHEYAFRLR